jgi:Transglutaminase-like superfamily
MTASRKKRESQAGVTTPSRPKVAKAPRRVGWMLPFTLGPVIVGLLVFVATHKALTSRIAVLRSQLAAKDALPTYPTLGHLAEMSADDLSRYDIALLNLRCAEGLPGSEKLNLENCLQTLDMWAEQVRTETDRNFYKFRKNAKDFENSEAYFRMLTLITVLQQDFKVHYNADRIRNVDFTKSQDLFIHGMIGSDNGGTCVSMPVLYTAVARRLGYPVYLISAKGHLFCRWHDSNEHVNCEATSQGLNTYPDEYYLKWPLPISEDEVKKGYYLASMATREELAVFLAARGHCLEDNGRKAEAIVSYAQALAHNPDSPDCFGFLAGCLGYRHLPAAEQSVSLPAIPEPPAVYPMQLRTNPDVDTTGYQDRYSAKTQAISSPQSPYSVYKPVVPNPYSLDYDPKPSSFPRPSFQP